MDNRHEDNAFVSETIPVIDFIGRLIWHIPEKHFKMIRYYGLYARSFESTRKIRRVISREKHPILLSFNRWRNCMFSSFGYDPLKCQDCGKTMLLLELYHNHHKVSLEELYERAMSKHRSCRSPSSSCAASPTCSKLYIKRRYAR